MLTNPLLVSFRSVLRRNAIARRAWRMWNDGRDYEQAFAQAVLAAVRRGDVVWDIGANVGLYTRRFLDAGASRVVCFEPAPAAAATLRREFVAPPAGAAVDVIAVALADRDGSARFAASGDSPTNSLLGGAASGDAVEVPLRRGERAQVEFGLPDPAVIKIDVEGHEPDVLRGLGQVLQSATLRAVFIEVHFALLEARGLGHAPAEMERRLRTLGFRTRWTDPSHLSATRS